MTRTIKPGPQLATVVAVVGVVVIVAAVALLLTGGRAGAQPAPTSTTIAAPPATTTGADVLFDEQNVRTDSAGRVLLRFDQGEHAQRCLSGKAVYVGVAPARNLDDPGNAPVTFQAAHHQRCDVLLVLMNEDNTPIADADLRITYTASAVPVLTGQPGAPAPAPELGSPEVLAALLGALDEGVYEGLTCPDFATAAAARAAYTATGGADGPLAHLDGPDPDALACSTEGEGVPAP